MITIRKQQVEYLDAIAAEEFKWRLVEFIRVEMPDHAGAQSEDRLYGFVVESERRAAEYGIETEQGIALFACLSLMLGKAADEIPEIKSGLIESDEPEDFLELLMDTIA
jgi:hypothetical protein